MTAAVTAAKKLHVKSEIIVNPLSYVRIRFTFHPSVTNVIRDFIFCSSLPVGVISMSLYLSVRQHAVLLKCR